MVQAQAAQVQALRAQVAQARAPAVGARRAYPARVARLPVSAVLQLAAAERAWRALAGCRVAQVVQWLAAGVLRLGWGPVVAGLRAEARQVEVVAQEAGAGFSAG